MSHNKLTIWCNNDFNANEQRERSLLANGVGAHQLLLFEYQQDGRDGESRTALKAADIAFGYPSATAVVECDNLRWVQLHSAGYTTFDRDEVKRAMTGRGTMLSNSSGVYDEPCAQHLLAMIMGLARQLPAALDSQRGDKSWPMTSLRLQARLLNEQTVLLLGFGAIARRLVELLQPLQVNLVAVRRRVSGGEPIRVEEIARVDELLPLADHVVNILPANEQTKSFLNEARLGSLKRGAIVYNIGRGTTVDQDALLKELRTGRIAAAYLDVTNPEPLPADHPLWTMPNCFITPHTAGGHSNEKERQVRHFVENLRRFERGETLVNRIW
jgi:phosphoglycerate dehydrogenase-like enzyme